MLALHPSPHLSVSVKDRHPRRVCFSFAAYAKNVIDHLRLMCHVPISEGLSQEECASVEREFGFTFPPDLRSILEEGLPQGVGFPNWRSGNVKDIRSLLDLPISALCLEISHGHFWCPSWGEKPATLEDALRIAIPAIKKVPTLIPIYANCYISCFPVQAGNPIFLVHEGKIHYCGYDIADFFKRQAFVPREWTDWVVEKPKQHTNSEEILSKMALKYTEHMKSLRIDNVEGTMPRLKTNTAADVLKENSITSKPNPKWRWAADSPRTPDMHPPDVSMPGSSCVQEVGEPKRGREETLEKVSMQKHIDKDASMQKHIDKDGQIFISKYLYYHEQALPSRMLTKFTMAAPPWAASKARRIEFWSDVAVPAGTASPSGSAKPPHHKQETGALDPSTLPVTDQAHNHPSHPRPHISQEHVSTTIEKQETGALDPSRNPSSRPVMDQTHNHPSHPTPPVTQKHVSTTIARQETGAIDASPNTSTPPAIDQTHDHPRQPISQKHVSSIIPKPQTSRSPQLNSPHRGRQPIGKDSHGLIDVGSKLPNGENTAARSPVPHNSVSTIKSPQPSSLSFGGSPLISNSLCLTSNASPKKESTIVGSPIGLCESCSCNGQGGSARESSYWVDHGGSVNSCTAWLPEYLEGLASILKKGQWREPDIREMLVEPSATRDGHGHRDDGSDFRGIALGIYSVFLRQAGWSDQDTNQMLFP